MKLKHREKIEELEKDGHDVDVKVKNENDTINLAKDKSKCKGN